jgi:hypothetical protein
MYYILIVSQGYGHDGAAAIKIHPFFRVIDWNALSQGKVLTLIGVLVIASLRLLFQMPSPIKLEDLSTDMPISASSKAKAKQAVQSRAFQVPPVNNRFCSSSLPCYVFYR